MENCNIRDTSDTANCMVAHPDHLTPTGMNSYTYMTRGALKKLLPTCQQPSAKQAAAAKAFQQRQQDIYNANVQKAEQQMKAPAQPAGGGSLCWQPGAGHAAQERRGTRNAPLRQLWTPACQLHRQRTSGGIQLDGRVRSAIGTRCNSASAGSRYGRSLSGRGQLAARLHRRRRAGELFIPLAKPGDLSPQVRRQSHGADHRHQAETS